MNGYAIGGLACFLYAAFVLYIGFKRPPALIKMVKLKLSKNMSDKAAAIVCYVFGTLVLVGGIILFIVGA